jgi:hypothetical protein
MPQPNEQMLGGHAVLAVGYDERAAAVYHAQLLERVTWDASWRFTSPY